MKNPRSLLLALFLCAAPAAAQPFVYSFSDDGRVAVNGYQIDDLKGSFQLDELDLDDVVASDFEEAWMALAVEGSDWTALRFDGRVEQNGVEILDLAFDDDYWVDVDVVAGDVWTLRTDGRVSRDGVVMNEFSTGSFYFTRLATDGEDVYVLRSDGRVFNALVLGAIFDFAHGADDGEEAEQIWTQLVYDPVADDLLGLRRDGVVMRGDLDDAEGGPVPGTLEAVLPFGDADSLDWGTAYWDVEVLSDGLWVATRGNGRVFRSDDQVDFLVDLPGDPGDDDLDQTYVDLLALGDEFLALRWDGNAYYGAAGTFVTDLPKDGWRQLVLSEDEPDLSNIKNAAPLVTGFKVAAITGTPVVVSVQAVDPDLASEDLDVDVDPATLPAGMVWDGLARTLTWDDPGPAGKYKVKVAVEDGFTTVKKTLTFVVKDPDGNPDKNAKPSLTKISKPTALKGSEIVLAVLAFDGDGDEVTVTVDETQYPYTAGATFDADTNTFHWTPTIADVGKVKLTFLVSDGTVTNKLKVTLAVKNTLLTL